MLRRIAVAVVAVLSSAVLPRAAHATSWAFDFVRFRGVTYADRTALAGRPLRSRDLGPLYATVRFRILGSKCEYTPTLSECARSDSVALSLPAGTRVYAVKGYRPGFRLAAYRNRSLSLFEAVDNPRAVRGGDLLDIAGKVRAIDVQNGPDSRSVLTGIRDPMTLSRLTAMIESAPVIRSQPDSPPFLTLSFRLDDATRTIRTYSVPERLLEGGIRLPVSFQSAISAALRSHSTTVSIVSADVEHVLARAGVGSAITRYATSDIDVRELADLAVQVRFPGVVRETPATIAWTVTGAGRTPFRRLRVEMLPPGAGLRTYRYSVPFYASTRGAYRLTVRVTAGSTSRAWSLPFTVLAQPGSLGTTFRMADGLDLAPSEADFERCLPGSQGQPPTGATPGIAYLLGRWSLRNSGPNTEHVPDLRLVLDNGSTRPGFYAGYAPYLDELQPGQSEQIEWAFALSEHTRVARLVYGDSPPDGRDGGVWVLKWGQAPGMTYCSE